MSQERREALAWGVLWGSLAAFLIVIGGAFVGFNWYRESATDAKEARLTILRGTVLLREKNQPTWVSAAPDALLREGASIRTDDTSEALITLFDRSTVAVFPRSEVGLRTMASARYFSGRQSIALDLKPGRLHIVVTPAQEKKTFNVLTVFGQAALDEGDFSLSLDEAAFRVRVREGAGAKVTAHNETVVLAQGQRTEVQDAQPPSPPQAAAEELVHNGDFRRGLEGWYAGNETGFRPGFDVVGEVTPTLEGGQPAVRFLRQGSKGTHCETYVVQHIEREVSDLSSLRLSLRMKLIHHSLSGGGYLGSEYPVLVRLVYRAVDGDGYGVWGFYYHNEADNRTDNGQQVPEATWVSYTVPYNLMDLSPRPRRILYLQVSASGWDYESLVTGISLEGE